MGVGLVLSAAASCSGGMWMRLGNIFLHFWSELQIARNLEEKRKNWQLECVIGFKCTSESRYLSDIVKSFIHILIQ